MNVRTTKRPNKRIDTSYVSRFRMQSYGNDNLYPQNLRLISSASGTTELCLARYAKFIEGYGFNDNIFSQIVVNRLDQTADDILHDISADLSRFGGFALHINYNVLCQITSVSFVPFENCRLEETDDAGNVAHVLVHPDWSGKATRNGRTLQINEKNILRFPIFNPDPNVVAQQIMNAGGIDSFQGQIMWCSTAGRFTYPTPIYDSVVTEISTDEGLGNIKYRNVRNNFMPSCMIVAKKGLPKINDEGREEEQHMLEPEDLKAFQGDEKLGKILYVEIENTEEAPVLTAFPAKNFDKEFSVTDSSVTERIYAQFHQELFYAIRIGKLGFSGQVMQDAYEYYAGEVTTEQRFVERAFKKIFAAWHDPSVQNVNMVLQPLKYMSAATTDNNSISNE